MKREEVCWHEVPDLKRRPVLILTRDEAIDAVYDVIAVPATGTIRGISTEVELGPDEGMPRSCVLNVDNTLSAEKAFLTERVTTLDAAKISEVCAALRVATDCQTG